MRLGVAVALSMAVFAAAASAAAEGPEVPEYQPSSAHVELRPE